MALTDNPFIGIPLVDLQEMQTLYVTVVKEIATTGQSYTAVGGRTFSAADLDKVKETLFQINQALNVALNRGLPRVATPRIYPN